MQFEYEITVDDYVACQLLYYKLSVGRQRIVKRAVSWTILGFLCIVVALSEQVLNWMPILLAVTGALWVYGGVRTFFPARYFRRIYPSTKLTGKRFFASADQEGIQITGEHASWRVQWAGVTLRAENERAFMLHSDETATIFMFGKCYLTDGQQQELRTLAGTTTK